MCGVWGKRKREREEAGTYYRKEFIRVRCLGIQEALVLNTYISLGDAIVPERA